MAPRWERLEIYLQMLELLQDKPLQHGTPLLQKEPDPLQPRQTLELLQKRLLQQGTPLLQKEPDPLQPRQMLELLQNRPLQHGTPLLQKVPDPLQRLSRAFAGGVSGAGLAMPIPRNVAARTTWYFILCQTRGVEGNE
ncbi:hypothetical protein AAL_05862 [Moelleriella libera RCEF 2490]|uniref:Uncharacterized protein n=1 Tax=Moelleriella libera RCEF 2490 TaxID=1081109 RepID=A0A166NW15_9HYPO|nr:hypothetical protein AAL_05862 [Moelleriella libera RCEF 2490]